MLRNQYSSTSSTQNISPILRNIREKGGKLGAIYNPNSLNPHYVQEDPTRN